MRIASRVSCLVGSLAACVFAALAVSACGPAARAQSAPALPKIVNQDGHSALMLDGAPYLILGAQIHNSSSWEDALPKVWTLTEGLNANTIEAPIYWEQMEQQQGQFDFSTADMLIQQAREHHVRLVLLWFGTWKNGRDHYVPEWIKTNTEKYPLAMTRDGDKIDVLSPYSENSLNADKAAFAALMRHIKQIDGTQQTVIMVQVENETGLLGSMRDYSPAANKLFNGPVPQTLVEALHKQPGTWSQVFGNDADESFSAYGVASYVNQVAAAGKAEYALPMYCNNWLHRPDGDQYPYPTGGPTYNMLDIWKSAAPNIDMIGPDIYIASPERYREVLKEFHRPDNPAWIPETIGFGSASPDYLFYALGEEAIGFSPFGLDTMPADEFTKHLSPQMDSLAASYRVLGSMDRPLAELLYQGKVKTAVEEPSMPTASQALDFGKWLAIVSFGPRFPGMPQSPIQKLQAGRALVAPIGPDRFVVVGFNASVTFVLAHPAAHEHPQYLRVEEGSYDGDAWKTGRWLNGDETDHGLRFGDDGSILHVSMTSYR